MKRIKAIFRGNVQGVGFRWTTLQLSESFDVTGWVKNLPNGTVELVAEGPASQVNGFLQSVSEKLGEKISEKVVEELAIDRTSVGHREKFEIE